MMDFTTPPQAPHTFTATPDSIVHTNDCLCDHIAAVISKVSAVPLSEATFENVCQPLINLEDEQQAVTGALEIAQWLSPDAAVRDAAAEANKKRSEFLVDTRDENVFRLINALFQNRANLQLHPEHLKWLVEEHRSYVRQGMLLDRTDREKYQQVKKQAAEAVAEFDKNFDKEQGPVLWFTSAELAGLPDGSIVGLERGTGSNEGKLKVDLKIPDNKNKVLEYCTVAKTREMCDTEFRQAGKENVPFFNDAVRLNQQAVRLLGYPSVAAYRLEVNMAKTPHAVSAFLDDLDKRIEPLRGLRSDLLLKRKQADLAARGQPAEEKLYTWDYPYYNRLYDESTFDVDHEKLSEYFPLLPTVRNMLKLFGTLFGFKFVELQEDERARLSPTGKASDLIWHEDVMMYSVWDDPADGGSFRGYLYLDLCFRDGKLRGYRCWPLNLGFEQPDGQQRYPATVLMTMFPKRGDGQSHLLRHNEVELLFHELGHGIHDLSGQAKCSRFFGASTAGDFNEAPSQMLEAWCWNPTGLKALSSHYETGRSLPDNMIDALLRTQEFEALSKTIGMLRMALWDMEVYSAEGHADLAAVYKKHLGQTKVIGPKDPHGYVQWRFLVEAGASMYQYLWAKVHAMDMFYSAFRANPLDGVEGRRYRRMVLQKGSTQDEMQTLVDFLGRQPNSDGFFNTLGLDG